MADLDREEQSAKPVKPAKPPRPKPALPKAGGGNIGMIVGWALALAALGAAGFLFTQVSALKKQIAEVSGPTPRGAAVEGEEHEAGATDAAIVDDWQEDAQQVTYELGKFTTNTADGQHAQMSVALRVESYYRQEEWEAYDGQMTAYEEQMKAYLEQQKGTPAEGEQALARPGLTPAAMHSAPKEAAPTPLEKPELPERPLTRLERELMKEDAMVRDAFIRQINATSSADFINEQGKQGFKQAVMDELNNSLPSHAGTVVDIFFKDLVTT